MVQVVGLQVAWQVCLVWVRHMKQRQRVAALDVGECRCRRAPRGKIHEKRTMGKALAGHSG
eukprot:28224-Chlamydomonas_euryale.AAC.3